MKKVTLILLGLFLVNISYADCGDARVYCLGSSQALQQYRDGTRINFLNNNQPVGTVGKCSSAWPPSKWTCSLCNKKSAERKAIRQCSQHVPNYSGYAILGAKINFSRKPLILPSILASGFVK